jgi:hypothetical protein
LRADLKVDCWVENLADWMVLLMADMKAWSMVDYLVSVWAVPWDQRMVEKLVGSLA